MSSKIELSENALTVAKSRYFEEGEDWDSCTLRVANSISEAEGGKKLEYRDKFHEMIYNVDFIPAGRILRNSGHSKGSLLNCFVLPIGDSIEEIGEFYKNTLILWANGAGVGANFSFLRPKGDKILGKGGESSGLVSFLEASDATAKCIESGGSRRAAGLACVDVSHPEVLDFIDAKLVDKKISHYNISIGINNEFLEAVERDSDWEFKFKQRSYGKVKARFIWDKIVNNMVNTAEPGLLNFTNLMKNNSYYFAPITSTNPCGEVALENGGCCCLGSLNLPNFITGNINTNWVKLEKTIGLAVRFLDNVIDVNKYSLKENDIKAHESRRIGLGVLGLANYLFAKKIRYGSHESIIEIEKLFRFIRDCTYQELVKLSVEKGAFPKFDPVQYVKSSFIRKLPVSMRMEIKNKGVRCVTALSQAPCGTISLVADRISGIEPLIAKAYRRVDRVSSRIYINPIYENILKEEGTTPDWFVDSYDLKPEDHLEVQSAVQKYVDGAISKTVNLPKETTGDDLSKLLLEYAKDLKGVTVYRDGSREGQILNPLTEEETLEYLKNNNKEVKRNLSEEDVQCVGGKCEI
jgi:ribonucleoside-diphosphate reductase alpha chain